MRSSESTWADWSHSCWAYAWLAQRWRNCRSNRNPAKSSSTVRAVSSNSGSNSIRNGSAPNTVGGCTRGHTHPRRSAAEKMTCAGSSRAHHSLAPPSSDRHAGRNPPAAPCRSLVARPSLAPTRGMEAVRRLGVVPHVGYQLEWGRLSSMACIFMSADPAASIRVIAPDVFAALANCEQGFACAIKRGMPLDALADRGQPYAAVLTRPDLVHLALSDSWVGQFASRHAIGRCRQARSGRRQDRRGSTTARKNIPDAEREWKMCSPASRRARVGPGASAPLPGAPPVCGGRGS